MLDVGYDRPAPSQHPEDDILQPSTSEPNFGPADRYLLVTLLGKWFVTLCECSLHST